MDQKEFFPHAQIIIEWIVQYQNNVEQLPVKPNIKPGEIYDSLSSSPPKKGESFDEIFSDFQNLIFPGITHWQHPGFYAYFNGNTSTPSILGEMLTAALDVQCMMWATSPAATELEEKVTDWLRDMLGLPAGWKGVLQDGGSGSNLCAILAAREKATEYITNEKGLEQNNLRIYCTDQAHSSVDKAAQISGIGRKNVVHIPTDENYAMIPKLLQERVKEDLLNITLPVVVVATVGTTGSMAIDPINEIAEICNKYNIWLHVDAAYAGSALVLPKYRSFIKGIELTDSFVMNPHKWLFTNFDCSALFVKDPKTLINTFSTTPEYLRTDEDEEVINYKDWGIQLGRRFRALKLWFVIRSFGVEGLQHKIQFHIYLAQLMEEEIRNSEDFELMAPVHLNLVCFRFHAPGMKNEEKLNSINEELLGKINNSGKAFLTHTKLDGKYVIRMVIGQTNTQLHHVRQTWELIKSLAGKLK